MRVVCVALCLLGLAVAGAAVLRAGQPAATASDAADLAGGDPSALTDVVLTPAAGSVAVNLVENVSQQPYAVAGSTADELRRALNRAGPYSGPAGARFDALTTWGLHWSFRYRNEGDSCSLAGATVEIDAVVALPQLATPDALSAATLARWQAYTQALQTHEQGHVDLQVAGAQALQSQYETAGSAPTCRDLGAALAALGDAQIEAGRAADTHYDADTDHGRLQGAVFP